MGPGATVFTLICRSASSRAIDFAKPFNPALEAAYAADYRGQQPFGLK